MAWNTLVFCDNDIFTGSDGNALQENFTALAEGQAGAPAIDVNSFIVTGVASISQLDVRSLADIEGLICQVGSIGELNVESLSVDNAVINSGSQLTANNITVNSSIVSEVGCFGNVDVSSNLSINGLNWPHFALRYDAGSPPTIIRQFNVSCLERITAGKYSIHVLSPAFTNSEYFLMGMAAEVAGLTTGARRAVFAQDSSNLSRVGIFNRSQASILNDDGEGITVIGFGD